MKKEKVKKTIDYNSIKSTEDLKAHNISFESAYAKLEEIVAQQESNNLSLEDSIKYYKLGKILLEYCQSILNDAKEEIERINNV